MRQDDKEIGVGVDIQLKGNTRRDGLFLRLVEDRHFLLDLLTKGNYLFQQSLGNQEEDLVYPSLRFCKRTIKVMLALFSQGSIRKTCKGKYKVEVNRRKVPN